MRRMLISILPILSTALSVAVLSGVPSGAQPSVDMRTLPAGDAPGSRDRRYLLAAPENLTEQPALVMILHGCRQTERDILTASRIHELAAANAADDDPANDFIAIFPFVTSYPSFLTAPRAENCWGWWFADQIAEGAGEAGDLRRIIAQVEAEFATNPARRYIAGLSSGGAMSAAMAVVYSEDITAAGTVAGLAYGETPNAVAIPWPMHHMQSWFFNRDANCLDSKQYQSVSRLVQTMRAAQAKPGESNLTPLMAIQSANDCTVEIQNGLNLRDVWISRYNGNSTPSFTRDCSADGVSCRHEGFDGPEGRVIETVFYEGARHWDTHYWVGGDPDAPYSEPDGPSASCLLLDFFGLSPTDRSLCQ